MNQPNEQTVLARLRELMQRDPAGLVPTSLHPLPEQGLLNFLYTVQDESGTEWIVRATDRPRRGNLRYFDKELWAMQQARAAGIPAPSARGGVIESSDAEGAIAYFVLERMPGVRADQLLTKRPELRETLYERAGAIASKLESIRCPGFGTSFDPTNERFIGTYEEVLREDMIRYGCDAEALGPVLTAAQYSAFQERLAAEEARQPDPGLNHGDLNFSNMLVDESNGEVLALLDWERAQGALVPAAPFANVTFQQIVLTPHYEPSALTNVFSGDGILQELGFFLRGYGISSDEYQMRHRDTVELLLLSKALPFLTWWHKEKGSTAAQSWSRSAESAASFAQAVLRR